MNKKKKSTNTSPYPDEASKEKQSVSDGERPVVHIAVVCGFWQGASYSGAHPVFYFVLNLLTHGSQPYFSNILPARRLKSNLHNAILFGIRRAFPDLAFDGFFALIVAGIAGVDYSGHRRASLRSVWGWMQPHYISYNVYHILCPIARLLSAVWWCSF